LITRFRALVALVLALALLSPVTASGAQEAAPRQDPNIEIIGGGQASPGEYPFMVAILKRNVANRFNAQFCGGSLIAENWVLSAAHCFRNPDRPANRLDVLVGTHRLATPGGERIHVAQVIVHPGYNPQTSGNDIALLRLSEASTYDPIPIIEPGNFDLWDPGTVATVIGWGDRDRRDTVRNYPVNLYEVTVPIVSNAGCRNAYGAGYIKTKMLCAGDLANGGRDSCQGDSGGPLFVPDGGSDIVQVGIVSFGVGCGLRRFPGVYTRLATYRNWLGQHLE
jgi:secreted trypsin-like serine protease